MKRKTKKKITKSLKMMKKTGNFVVEMAEDMFDAVITSKVVKDIKKKMK